jgi:hypothetical protein
MLSPCDLWVRATTSRGAPVPGAVVVTSHFIPSQGVTDPRGRVRLPGRNRTETLRVTARGFLDAWHEVVVPDRVRRIETPVTLLRPASLLVRAVGRDGRPVPVLVPDLDDVVVRAAGPGEILLTRVPPGPLSLDLADREGRSGTLRITLEEGENRVETVVLE